MATPQLTQFRRSFPAATARMAGGCPIGNPGPALKGSPQTSEFLFAGDSGGCNATVAVCAHGIFRFAYRFGGGLAEPPSQFAAEHSAASLMHKE